MATAPIEFPPPVDSAQEFVGAPTDPEDERIEVGVVIVGGGPGGLACAIRLTQLLAEDEALMESLGEVPVALVEKGKGPGSHLLSGAMMNPSAMRALFPDLDESEWPTYGAMEKDAVYLLPNGKRAIPLKPTPPPFRNHGNHVTSVAQLGRWLSQQAEEAGVYILGETSGHRLLVEDGAVVGVRSGDKGRGRDGEELSNFEPGSDLIAKATVLAEGTAGHLTGAAIRHFEHRLRGPAAVGARGEGDLGGRAAARPGHPHDGLAAPLRGEVPRVRRLVHVPDGRGPGVARLRGRPRLPGRALLRARRAPADEAASAVRGAAGGRQARRLGREDDPVRRLLGAAAQAVGAWRGDRRRRRRDGERAHAQGRPLRDARRDVRGRGDLRAAEGRRRQPPTSRTTRRRSRARRSRRTPTARATCASRSRRASSSAARSRT